LQMDIKVTKVTTAIMREALEQARKARLQILDKMVAVISEPRKKLSPHAPMIHTLTIPTDKIRELIGPGGKMIPSSIAAHRVKIDVSDDRTVNIFATNGPAAEKAIQMVTDI